MEQVTPMNSIRARLTHFQLARLSALAFLAGIVLLTPGATPLFAQGESNDARPPIVWPPDPTPIDTVEEAGDNDAAESATAGATADFSVQSESPIPAASNYGAWTRMVFVRGTGRSADLYLANGDGTNEVELTSNNAFEDDPALSPDGTRIVFVADYDGDETVSIYSMKIDGTGVAPLIHGNGDNYDPAWSSDGRYLAFTSNRNGVAQVWVRDLATGVDSLQTFAPFPEFDPAFQPGTTNLYRIRVVGPAHGSIFRAQLGGGNELVLTDPILYPGGTTVAPSGKVAFHYLEDPENYGAWFSVGVSSPESRQARLLARGIDQRDFYVDDWAPVAQLPGAMALIVNAADYVRSDGAWRLSRAQILFWDAEESRLDLVSTLVNGNIAHKSSTRGMDTTPPNAWTLPAPRQIESPMPETLAYIAWSGADTQSNIAGYRFFNEGTEPVWVQGTNITQAPELLSRFHLCGVNRYSVRALDWAGNWGAVSPERTMMIATHHVVDVTDARNVPLIGARAMGDGAFWVDPTIVSGSTGRFISDSCVIPHDSSVGFEKTGYTHINHSFWRQNGVGKAILHVSPISLNQFDGQAWEPSGPWASPTCMTVVNCPLEGLTLGREPGAADGQRTESSFTTEIDLSDTTAMHAMTLNFMLAMRGRAGSPNLLVLKAQANGDAEPTVIWQRKGTNFNPSNIWVNMNPWRGKVVTLTYKLTTEFGVPPSLAIIGDPVISDWLTPNPRMAAIAPDDAFVANADSVAATTLMTITGENFIAPVSLRFGATAATVLSATESTIVAQVPANLSPGKHDIVVVNPGGQSAAMAEGWFVGRQVWLPSIRYE